MTHIAIKQHNVELARVNITRDGRGAEGDCLEDSEIRVAEKLAGALHTEGLMQTGYYSIELVGRTGEVIHEEVEIL